MYYINGKISKLVWAICELNRRDFSLKRWLGRGKKYCCEDLWDLILKIYIWFCMSTFSSFWIHFHGKPLQRIYKYY